MPGEGVAISLQGVRKRFGEVEAVREVTADIPEGEFFTMLGPSGCGKTTTLRMIAGFEQPDEGRILLRGDDVTDVSPNHRNVNMVFQHYALFPHMSIYDNVAFGLKLKKFGKEETRERVAEMLRIVELEGYEKRRPSQLSGGQQQRVALARALVNRPAALLLDEPLGALDVKLRKQLQLELKRIQSELGTTFVYVTHDQEEALSMSDRIAVMDDGLVEQIGSPREIYEHPRTAFVADFIGSLNAFDFRVDSVDGELAVMRVSDGGRLVVSATGATQPGVHGQGRGTAGADPDRGGERARPRGRLARRRHDRTGRLPRIADPVPRRHRVRSDRQPPDERRGRGESRRGPPRHAHVGVLRHCRPCWRKPSA